MNKITEEIIENTKEFLYDEDTKNKYKTTKTAFTRNRSLTFFVIIFISLNFLTKSL